MDSEKEKPRKKCGGRKKGVPNKRTQLLIDRAEALGVDPFEIILLVAKGDWRRLGYKSRLMNGPFRTKQERITLKDRMWAAAEACQYLYPKRKAIEVTGKDGGPLDVFLRMTPEERAAKRAELEKRMGKS